MFREFCRFFCVRGFELLIFFDEGVNVLKARKFKLSGVFIFNSLELKIVKKVFFLDKSQRFIFKIKVLRHFQRN